MALEIGKLLVREDVVLCHILEGGKTLTDRSDSLCSSSCESVLEDVPDQRERVAIDGPNHDEGVTAIEGRRGEDVAAFPIVGVLLRLLFVPAKEFLFVDGAFCHFVFRDVEPKRNLCLSNRISKQKIEVSDHECTSTNSSTVTGFSNPIKLNGIENNSQGVAGFLSLTILTGRTDGS
jgi:hypothetical protein